MSVNLKGWTEVGENLKKKSQRSRWKFQKKNMMEADRTIFQKRENGQE